MSNLLLEEYPLVVLPALASKVGLNEAIILQQIHYWTTKSKTEAFGFKWIYNTIEDWQKQFPFWSDRTIRRGIDSLKEQGLIQTAKHITGNKFDHVLFYRVNYVQLQNVQFDLDKMTESTSGQDGQPDLDKMAKCYRDYNTDITDTKDIKPKASHAQESKPPSLPIKKEKTEYDKNDLISIGIDESIARDFLITRKAKKAKLTETAFAGIVREAEKANLTIQQALQICVERNWQSFNAEWVKDKQSGQYITYHELVTGMKPEF